MRANGRATVENEEDLDEVEAGPEMPMEEEDEAPDAEEGRFFGGGVTKGTAEVLDFIDARDGQEVVGLNNFTTQRINLRILEGSRKV